MKLQLDRFSKDALANEAERRGEPPEVVLLAAARHYLRQRPRRRAAWHVPRFLRLTEEESSFEFPLDNDVREELEAEARRQEVSPETLAEHALLLYLADLDGRHSG